MLVLFRSVHACRADGEIRRRDHAGALPDRGMRNRLHPALRALLRQAVRRRGHDRHLAPVRDAEGLRARHHGDRGLPEQPALRRLCQAARAAMRADRLLRCRAVHGADCGRSEEHTSELQSLMRNSYAVFCLKKNTKPTTFIHTTLTKISDPLDILTV